MHTFYEFFAGGGMARQGLGESWQCLWANDIDPKKCAAYRTNWGDGDLIEADIAKVSADQLPGIADLAWASFPCQDLSVAGNGKGLGGERSGTFWHFWRIIDELSNQSRAPRLIVLENVMGLITSSQGRDFTTIIDALVSGGYLVGALHINADILVPQSRPRLFIVGVRDIDQDTLNVLTQGKPHPYWHNRQIVAAWSSLSETTKNNWIWWSPSVPEVRTEQLDSIIIDNPTDVEWDSEGQTKRILNMMSPLSLEKIASARRSKEISVGTIYKRTRKTSGGERVQRAEVRFDGIAGCLRTPSGGSSRQTIIVIGPDNIRTRLLSGREAARLMGLPESFKIPSRYNDAYHLMGDGVVAPVVSLVAKSILEPLLGNGWFIREVRPAPQSNLGEFVAS